MKSKNKFASKEVISHDRFMQKLDEKFPDRKWEVVGKYEHNKIPILVRDKYGDCLIPPNNLMQRSNPSVKTAINQTLYTINRFKEIWEDTFDYSKFIYLGATKKSVITCRVHGDFYQHANSHLSGRGCLACANDAISERVKSSTSEFVEKAFKVHDDYYDYSLTNYINAKTEVIIICPQHGKFSQIPNTHLSGSGCTQCGRQNNFLGNYHTVAKDKECTFYVLECFNDQELFLKIGITSNSVETRFEKKDSMPYHYNILRTIKCDDYEAVFYLEQMLLSSSMIASYNPKINFHGRTECRNYNIKNSLLRMVDDVGDLKEYKQFCMQMLGKDEAFNKRFKEVTGHSHHKAMSNLNKHIDNYCQNKC